RPIVATQFGELDGTFAVGFVQQPPPFQRGQGRGLLAVLPVGLIDGPADLGGGHITIAPLQQRVYRVEQFTDHANPKNLLFYKENSRALSPTTGSEYERCG